MKESKSMQCIVDIERENNHSTTVLQTVSFKDINKSTAAKVKSYFEIGLLGSELSESFTYNISYIYITYIYICIHTYM